jgi:homoserine/homoserine lactone efflux protein
MFRKSFLVAITNPKRYLFFAAFLPQFVDTSHSLMGQYAVLELVFILIDVSVMAAYAMLGVNAMRFLREQRAKWLERCCGAFVPLLAVGLAMYRRT